MPQLGFMIGGGRVYLLHVARVENELRLKPASVSLSRGHKSHVPVANPSPVSPHWLIGLTRNNPLPNTVFSQNQPPPPPVHCNWFAKHHRHGKRGARRGHQFEPVGPLRLRQGLLVWSGSKLCHTSASGLLPRVCSQGYSTQKKLLLLDWDIVSSPFPVPEQKC